MDLEQHFERKEEVLTMIELIGIIAGETSSSGLDWIMSNGCIRKYSGWEISNLPLHSEREH